MNEKTSNNSNFWNVFSTAISFLAILVSGYAIFVVFEAKNINKDALGIQLDQISQEYAAKAYDEQYYERTGIRRRVSPDSREFTQGKEGWSDKPSP